MKDETINEIFTDQISDPKDAMRSVLDREALWELAENIKQNGLINPITVRPKGNTYEVVAGHRRLSACKIAGIIKISCVVRELNDDQVFEIMAAENLERTDVDPVDEANFIRAYMDKTGKTHTEVAKSLKRSPQYVSSRIIVAEMPDYMQHFLRTKELKLGVALVLMEIDNDQTREVWTGLAVRDGASVAQAEYWLMDYKRQLLPGGIRSDTPPDGYTAEAPQPIMFECAIDGQKYDARLMKSLLIYEGNYSLFIEFAAAIREPAELTNSELGGD